MKRIYAMMITVACLASLAAGCGDDNTQPTNFTRADRMGIPTINTVLIPSGMKNAFNTGDPTDDASVFASTAEGTITALRNAVNSVSGFPPEDNPGVPANTLAGVLIPDVVTINFSQPLVFTNGRRLQDDVVDAAVGLVLNRGNVLGGGAGVSDGIDSNDRTFLTTFPYLAAPH